jgi:hypothetical protein
MNNLPDFTPETKPTAFFGGFLLLAMVMVILLLPPGCQHGS